MSDWLKSILEDAAERAADRPEWKRSEYAQRELARLQDQKNHPSDLAQAKKK